MARPTNKTGYQEAKKRNVPNGMAYIQSTFNNRHCHHYDQNGDKSGISPVGLKVPRREHPLQPKLLLKVRLVEQLIRVCARECVWTWSG